MVSRALSGVDERKLAGLLDEVAAQLSGLDVHAKWLGSAAVGAGRSVGDFLQTQGGRLARRGKTAGDGE